jgi:transcriptional regulator PpsR
LNAAVARHFKAPEKTLGSLDAETAATLILAAADIALVLDRRGIIRDIAVGSEDLSAQGVGKWLGRAWIDTVTAESRPKIETLLREAGAKAAPRWRQVNHPSPKGADIPVLYSAVQLAEEGRVVAVGRDLRSIAVLQQRLVDAQQSMERDYARLRHAETRYRLLFQIASEAVLIVEAATQKVTEANPAAHALLGVTANRIVGRPFPEGFDAKSTRAVQSMLAAVQAAGKAADVKARLADGGAQFVVSASLFRQEKSVHFLVRLAPEGGQAPAGAVSGPKSKLLEVVESSPDGFVVTDPEGRILTANRAFLEMVQLATDEQARGELLGQWLGRPGVDLSILLSNLKQHGSVRLFATTVRGEYGSTMEVEISAVAVPHGEQPCLGFTLRSVGRRFTAAARGPRELPRSVEQLTELIGRVPLKELVRETTDVIERLCIEAALELTQDNRATAAEMLGLSRQSLYVKLRRYGIADDAADDGK